MIEDAKTFMSGLCETLGLPTDSALPAYEDPAHFLLAERKLPVNVTTEANKLDDPAERERIARVFDRGLGTRRELRSADPGLADAAIAAAAGSPSAGRSGATSSSSCRAIRPPASVCHSRRFRSSPPSISRTSFRVTR